LVGGGGGGGGGVMTSIARNGISVVLFGQPGSTPL
jgi:hypothetical protein